jgi:hypothetical protein
MPTLQTGPSPGCKLVQVRGQWLCLRRYDHEKNPKHEARSSKQISMTEIQMFQTVHVIKASAMILFLALGHLIFEFVSDFDLPARANSM